MLRGRRIPAKFCLIFLVMVLMSFVSTTVFAAGTPAGTNIDNGGDAGTANTADVSGDLVATYTNGATFYTTSPITTTTINSVYDMDPISTPSDKTGSPGSSVYYPYVVTNKANTDDAISLNVAQAGGSFTTSYKLIQDDSEDGIHDPGETTKIGTGGSGTVNLSPDTSQYFFVEVTIPATATDAETNTYTLTVKNQNGAGTEDNWPNANGQDAQEDEATTTVAAPKLYLVKSVDKQLVNPYDTLTYTIIYDNDGSAAVENLVIEDVIPNNTTYVGGSASTSNSYHAGSCLVEVKVGGVWEADSATPSGTVTAVRWTFDTNVAIDDGDTHGSAEDESPSSGDTDAGTIMFQVTVN